jgi:putative hydrolase of the HAD superfamily
MSRAEVGAGVGVVRHVLLDADEVLQHPGDLGAASQRYGEVSAEMMRAIEGLAWEPLMRGERDLLVDMGEVLRTHRVEADIHDVFDLIWRSVVVDPTSMALVDRLREAGYGVHLGTNQEHHRARFMRESLGLDEGRFGVAVYSCEIGLAKPDPAYFSHAVGLIGAEPHEVLFVDDRQENVEGARAAGLRAERWELAEGHERLHALLAGHGIDLPVP